MERKLIDFWQRVDALLEGKHNLVWLADATGIRQTTISGWRINDRLPTADRAVKIAHALGVSVEFLVTGSAAAIEDVEHIPIEYERQFRTPSQKVYTLSTNQRVINVPILDQKVSAGYGEDIIDDFTPNRVLPVLERLVKRFDKNQLKVVEVKGDSMTGIQIFSGDLVVFAAKYIEGDGVYVISIHDEAYVKRLEFDAINQKVIVHSENKNYGPKSFGIDSDNVRIEGKVVGWYHNHPY